MTFKSLCTAPSDCYPEIEDAYIASLHAYRDYIRGLCLRNPSLSTLSAFLSAPNARRSVCRVVAVDYWAGSISPDIRAIPNVSGFRNALHKATENKIDKLDGGSEDQLQGRILLIEDLTVEMITILGTELEVDPLFLATHLHTVHRTGMRHQTPDDATLPSRFYQSNYVNISYHEPVTCDKVFPVGAKFMADAAINRKLVFLRATNIGLAQHRVSVFKMQREDGFWLALVLVDPPLGHVFTRGGDGEESQEKVRLDLNPYLGTYEDFMEVPPFSQSWKVAEYAKRDGLWGDLVQYWNCANPRCFDPKDPSIQSLAYYPLRIVAAEWVKYIAVMQHCIKLYEYEGNHLDLEKFNMDLRELQGWRRRSMVSQHKIRAVIRHLRMHTSNRLDQCADVELVLEDYEAINRNIEEAGRRLENMLPVVTSLVQIIDARQSFAETANISRLTVLALVFVPLSYVSSLFSMNTTNMPGSSHFWVYFAVAIPVTLVVFVIARPPTRDGLQDLLFRTRNAYGRLRLQTLPQVAAERPQTTA